MSSNPKRTSYFEEEIITVKPSTELIPDEYKHFQESQHKIVLHTFVANDAIKQDLEQDFLKTLEDIGFETASAKKHNLENDNFTKLLNEIVQESNTNNDAGLILFFSGFEKGSGKLEIFNGINQDTTNIQQIWSSFDSHNCPGLKNKPKIFIFDLSTPEAPIQTDSKRHSRTAYDTPAEADILVIYNNTISGIGDFLENFCAKIRAFGKTENIITLASCAMSSSTLIISTLTRNFYFTDSNLRGLHHIIDNHNDKIKTNIKEIKEVLAQKPVVKKEKRNFLESLKFLKKSKADEESPNCSSINNKTKNSTSSSPTSSKLPTSTNPPIRENVDTSRSRHMSLSENDGGKPNFRRKSEKREKPIWRP